MNSVRRFGAKLTSPESVFHLPAVQALFYQILSFSLVLLIARGLVAIFDISVNLWLAAFFQGLLAACFSCWRKLASWWLAIQLFFPLVLLFALSLQLPPMLFMLGFLALLFLYWTTFRTQVPFYPSGSATWQAVAELLPQELAIRFIDIGSGLGGLTLNLAERRPESEFTGIEIAPLPWLVSVLRVFLTRSRARFKRGDYRHLDFAAYDVVFAYLSPVAMPALWEKARAEMRAGTLLLSYEFLIPDVVPTMVIAPLVNHRQIYCWRM